MREGLLLLALFLFGSGVVEIKSAPTVREQIFFLKDKAHHQWCGYKSESEWPRQMVPIPPLIVGGAEYENNRLSLVHVSEVDETADWRVYDDYVVNKNGDLESLKREISIIPGHVNEEEIWIIKNGVAIQQGPKTDPNSRPVLLNVPVITKLRSFPFWPLLRDKRQEVLSKGQACAPEK
jgi:hypothetical protein